MQSPLHVCGGESGWVGARAAVTVTAAVSDCGKVRGQTRRDVTRFKTPRSESMGAEGQRWGQLQHDVMRPRSLHPVALPSDSVSGQHHLALLALLARKQRRRKLI